MKYKNLVDNRYYYGLVFIVSYILWLFIYLSYTRFIPYNLINTFDTIMMITIGLVSFSLLLVYGNTSCVIPWIVFVPFVFGHPFDALSIPYSLYIGVGLLLIGIVCHIIRFGIKLKFGKFLSGLLVLGLAIVLGGINIKTEFYRLQIVISLFAVIAIFLAYIFFSSTCQIEIKNVARIMTYLGLFLAFQAFTCLALNGFSINVILSKSLNSGWGAHNNIGLMLLLCFPFTLYLASISKNKITLLYIFLAAFQCATILLTLSRGSIASLVFGLLILLPLMIFISKDRKHIIISYIMFFVFFMAISSLFVMLHYDYVQYYFRNLFNMSFTSLNGRTPIYIECVKELENNPWFGKGILSSLHHDGYLWGHSTILQTASTMGIVGLCSLGFHLFQKYYNLIIKPKKWKIFFLFGFLLSGLYGLIDVSYYFINYMIPLICILIMIEYPLMQEENNCKKVL